MYSQPGCDCRRLVRELRSDEDMPAQHATPDYSRVPQELKDRPQWVIWRYAQRGERVTKLPLSVRTGTLINAQDPANWFSFAEAERAVVRYRASGIGYVVSSEDPYTVGDLDHCIVEGKLLPWAQEIIDAVATYTEITPSGEGLRFFVRGALPRGGRKRGNIELYDSARYLTVTGDHWPGTPVTIEERTEPLHALHRRVFRTPAPEPVRPAQEHDPLPLDDDALLASARSARNGPKFVRLYDFADTSGYNSPSEAVMGLTRLLAFHTGADPARIDALMRQSALLQEAEQLEKWERTGDRLIARVLDSMTEFRARRSAPQPQRTETGPAGIEDSDTAPASAIDPSFPSDPSDPGPAPDENSTLADSLTIIGTQLERRLRQRHVSVLPCGLRFDAALDCEDWPAIGKALSRAEGQFTTVIGFAFGDWYSALPKRKRQRIVSEAFKLYGPALYSKIKRLSEYAAVARAIPQPMRNPNRSWRFYTVLSRLSAERRAYWSAQAIVPGLLRSMEAEAEALASSQSPARSTASAARGDLPDPVLDFSATSGMSEVASNSSAPSSSPVYAYNARKFMPPQSEETAESEGQALAPTRPEQSATLTLPLPLYAQLQDRAARVGLSAVDYLRVLLARDPAPFGLEAGDPAVASAELGAASSAPTSDIAEVTEPEPAQAGGRAPTEEEDPPERIPEVENLCLDKTSVLRTPPLIASGGRWFDPAGDLQSPELIAETENRARSP